MHCLWLNMQIVDFDQASICRRTFQRPTMVWTFPSMSSLPRERPTPMRTKRQSMLSRKAARSPYLHLIPLTIPSPCTQSSEAFTYSSQNQLSSYLSTTRSSLQLQRSTMCSSMSSTTSDMTQRTRMLDSGRKSWATSTISTPT